MLSVRLDVTLTLLGPILTKSTTAGLAGIGAAMAQSDGRYYLPYSLVRGRLRQALEDLDIDSVTELLGPGPQATVPHDSVEPKRGLLRFSDFRHASPSVTERLSYRVSIDPERGAAARRELLVIDSPFGPGEEVAFSGSISFFADEDSARKTERDVLLGLRFMTSLGSGRTVGFGRLKNVTVKREQSLMLQSTGGSSIELPPTDCLTLTLSDFSESFCVVKRPSGKNLFVSDETIPGSVIKGALAELLSKLPKEAFGALRSCLERVRFTHAFPGAKKRPTVPPLSLVKVKEDPTTETHQTAKKTKTLLLDAALCEGAFTISNRAPEFSVDWKDHSDVRKLFGWPEMKRELRVRTAINRDRQRADDGMLFAYEMIKPGKLNWHGYVDLHRVDPVQKQIVAEQLAALLGRGLPGIGKTKTHAASAVLSPHLNRRKAQDQEACWILCLQTPALLVDPLRLHPGVGSVELNALYQQVFDDFLVRSGVSTGTVKLNRLFATQAMYGGYLVHRFQKPATDRPYYPFLLTEAGSVFVLSCTDPALKKQVQPVIESWMYHGLPLSSWAADRYGNDWRTCPFVPENGFGEIMASGVPETLNPKKTKGFEVVPNAI